MSNFIYCTPVKSGDIYPPVNSTIANAITDWHTLPVGTQARYSLDNGQQATSSGYTVFVENFLYGMILGNSPSLEYRKNGVVQTDDGGNPIKLKTAGGTALEPTEVIYGYSVTNTYFNLWTEQSYLDSSSEVLYGKRGLYLKPGSNNKWDVVTTRNTPAEKYTLYGSFLFGVSDNAIFLAKYVYPDRTTYFITAGYSGNYRDTDTNFPMLGVLKAEPIDTSNLEVVVSKLTDKVKQLEGEIKDIDTHVKELVPNLTKMINEETSRIYTSR